MQNIFNLKFEIDCRFICEYYSNNLQYNPDTEDWMLTMS